MRLHKLQPTPGSTHKRKRVGRGPSSGHGKTSGRGHKGQNARSGGGVRPGFEGGQTPLFKRLPKRGFTNIHRVEYDIVNVKELNCFRNGAVITPERLVRQGLVKKNHKPIKILGDGELNVRLKVKANSFSKTAEQRILDAGGTIEVL